MKAKEKVAFSKFFPSSQQFVVIEGKASAPNDFSINIDIGDGSEKTSFYIDSEYFKDNASMLRAMRDGMQKALEFYEKALKLPAVKAPNNDIFSDWIFEKPAATKAKKKKAAVKK